MPSKRRTSHLTSLCATVEKMTAPSMVRLGDLAITYKTAGRLEDASALMKLRNDLEAAVDRFKREAAERYS